MRKLLYLTVILLILMSLVHCVEVEEEMEMTYDECKRDCTMDFVDAS